MENNIFHHQNYSDQQQQQPLPSGIWLDDDEEVGRGKNVCPLFRHPATYRELRGVLTSLIYSITTRGDFCTNVPAVETAAANFDSSATSMAALGNKDSRIRLPLSLQEPEGMAGALEEVLIERSLNSFRVRNILDRIVPFWQLNFRFHPDPPELRHPLEHLLRTLHSTLQATEFQQTQLLTEREDMQLQLQIKESGRKKRTQLHNEGNEKELPLLSTGGYADYMQNWARLFRIDRLSEEDTQREIACTIFRKQAHSSFDLSLIITADQVERTSVEYMKDLILKVRGAGSESAPDKSD